ncbi:hypothetical protein ACYEXS_19620 [Paenibacillus sp. MAH-36]|uniref:Uncharacterized protein n=1 Tax=Paenibacillus violae TaxID=3077234 RepID=A0ABU3R7W8_9BACL|nr:hypothetical protein [Paenibacillus sp. PFR10]MDU0200154.1 hypothetical protein [Paenibacillus sp. PFR10]
MKLKFREFELTINQPVMIAAITAFIPVLAAIMGIDVPLLK